MEANTKATRISRHHGILCQDAIVLCRLVGSQTCEGVYEKSWEWDKCHLQEQEYKHQCYNASLLHEILMARKHLYEDVNIDDTQT